MSFVNYVLAGYPLLWSETYEEFRAVRNYILELTKSKEKYTVYTWDRVDGVQLAKVTEGKIGYAKVKVDPPSEGQEPVELNDPMAVLGWLEKAPENTILFLKDYHHYIEKDFVIRKIRNLIPQFKASGKVLVVLSPCLKIPPEIKKDITVLPFNLPTKEELKVVLTSVCTSAEIDYPKDDSLLVDSALGMTAFEAENAFAVSTIEGRGSFDVGVVQREKAAIVRKTGLLEIMQTPFTLDDVGGLENVKNWLLERANCFTEEARAKGIRPPKGIMLAGPPGTGKTLLARVCSHVLKRPCLKMDLGKMYGRYVGDSEENIRNALQQAEAVAPCVVVMDEFEKALGGSGDSGMHETTERVQGTLLQWMNDRTADVFVVATANRVANIRAENLRGGRIDKIFWVDLPGFKQRQEIITIHLRKVGQVSAKGAAGCKGSAGRFDIVKLAKAAQNLTGAETEVWVQESLVRAFSRNVELNTDIMLEVLPEITTIVQLMGAELEEGRTWARNHGAKWASNLEEEQAAPEAGPRKIGKNQ